MKKQMQYILTMECYAAMKKKEIMSYTTTWMKPEDTMDVK